MERDEQDRTTTKVPKPEESPMTEPPRPHGDPLDGRTPQDDTRHGTTREQRWDDDEHVSRR